MQERSAGLGLLIKLEGEEEEDHHETVVLVLELAVVVVVEEVEAVDLHHLVEEAEHHLVEEGENGGSRGEVVEQDYCEMEEVVEGH